MIKNSISIVFILVSFGALAESKNAELKYYAGLGFGEYNTSLDRDALKVNLNDFVYSQSGMLTDMFAGAKFSNNFIAELSLTSGSNTSFLFGALDSITIAEIRATIGYDVPLSEEISFIPRIGVSDWLITAQEGALFNPGPEEFDEIEGTDVTWDIGLEFFRKSRFGMSVNFGKTLMDEASVDRTSVRFHFRF